MAVRTGEYIANEGLVFGYDTGFTSNGNRVVMEDSSKFSKGKPGYNYVAYQTSVATHPYSSYSATSDATWSRNHANAITAFNAKGNGITGYVNSGVGSWESTYHAHWQYDEVLKRPVVVMDCFDGNWKAKSYGVDTPAWSTLGVTTGTKYVISWLQWTSKISKALHVGVYCKNSAGTNNFWDGLSGGSATSKNTKPFTWERVYHVYTVSSNHHVATDYETIYMYGHSLSPNDSETTIKVASPQIELFTEYPSAYIPLMQNNNSNSSQRTNTESLYDLTGNQNIDVSNVSFSATTSLPTFDGTDDYIGKTRKQYQITEPWSVEVVFKPTDDNDTSWNGLFGGNLNVGGYWMFHSSGNLTYYEGYSGSAGTQISYRSWTKANTFNAGDFHHLVITYTPTSNTSGTFNLYYNGGEKTDSFSRTFTWSHSLDSNYIGMGGGNRYGTNDIHIYKEYNKVLSADKVNKKYLTYKNRFNI